MLIFQCLKEGIWEFKSLRQHHLFPIQAEALSR